MLKLKLLKTKAIGLKHCLYNYNKTNKANK